MRLRRTWPLLLLGLLLAAPVQGQGPASDLIHSKERVFRIPFQTDPGERRLQQVQLHVSTDQGKQWTLYANAAPDQGFFRQFTAPNDGQYWFAVRTVDQEGRAFPRSDEDLKPGLKVQVDTQPPTVTLRPLPPRDGEVGLEWEVRDDNLNPSSLRLDYQLPGTKEWQPLPGNLAATGQRYWRPPTNGNVEVRLQARDLASNEGEGKTVVAARPAMVDHQPDPAAPQPTVTGNIRMVNSRRISLEYDVQDVGPSGLLVELWYTQDGRNWQKYKEERNPTKPYVFNIEVTGEGKYGLTLVVRSGVGMGDRPPQVGDPPQVWIEVDETKPVVRLQRVDVGKAAEARNLTITWNASDRNLAPRPITLSYAEQPDGPWKPIDANLENTGRYVWQMPDGVPYQFLVRVEAADRAGNIGTDQTPPSSLVKVDLLVPKIPQGGIRIKPIGN